MFLPILKNEKKKNNSLTLTVSFYDVSYAFQSEPKLCSWDEFQGSRCSKRVRYLTFKWLQRGLNPQSLSS